MNAAYSLFFFIGFLLTSVLSLAQTPTQPADSTADANSKPCFECKGTGKAKCSVASCKGGQANCPNPCLKPDDGTWVHMTVAGHPATDVWKRFRKRDGSWTAWNQGHAGEVIQMQNGEPTNVGKCTVCGGTTKVKCAVCKGTGKVTCPICEGKKAVPQSWTAFDNPKMKNRPTHFKLKDGREIVGRKVSAVGSSIIIKTETGNVTIQASDLASEKPPTSK